MNGRKLSGLVLISKFIFFILYSFASKNPDLPKTQHKAFREWVVLIAEDQISRGVNPRWFQQDCAGLIRFAVNEAFMKHDEKWRKANGFIGKPLPPELEISSEEKKILKSWRGSDGKRTEFVRALPLIQQNTIFLGKSIERIEPGDLLFFDQGDEQHVMLWTGKRIVYHNGSRANSRSSNDNGLRAVSINDLFKWPDVRWRPTTENPNFTGYYRFSFLEKNIE